jgi:hypothetical protein
MKGEVGHRSREQREKDDTIREREKKEREKKE